MIRFGLILLCTTAVSCSLGTEVGNGLRPKTPSPSPSEPNPSDPSRSEDTPTGLPGGNQGQNDPNKSVGNNKPTDGAPFGTDTVWSLLTAACASPWAQALRSPTELVADRGEFAEQIFVRGDYDAATQTWTLKNAEGTVRYRLQPNPAETMNATLVFGADNQPLLQDTTCNAVTERADVSISGSPAKVTEKAVTLTRQGVAYVLKWYIETSVSQKILRQVDVENGGDLIYRLQSKL